MQVPVQAFLEHGPTQINALTLQDFLNVGAKLGVLDIRIACRLREPGGLEDPNISRSIGDRHM
jgi:hypothetical protein